MKDQGALIRAFTKWDDEPRSVEALAEAMLRGFQLAITNPFGPVYICLDAGLQEQKIEHELNLPNPARYGPPAPPPAPGYGGGTGRGTAAECQATTLPVWSGFAQTERLGAACPPGGNGRSIRADLDTCKRSVFPTEHGLHAGHPFYWANQRTKDLIKNSDVIVSFDWVDLNGLLLQVVRRTDRIQARIAHVSLDSTIHNGASMDYFGLAPIDVPIMANPDAFVEQLLPVLERRLGGQTPLGRHYPKSRHAH